MSSPELKDLRRLELYLTDLLRMSRAERRRRGVRLERYRIELELGAVQKRIELLENEERAAETLAG